ncbi:MAG: hypothetical protein WA376_17140, partial [Terrimicrobiaceae bacterium]
EPHLLGRIEIGRADHGGVDAEIRAGLLHAVLQRIEPGDAGDLADAWINLAFSVRLAERYRASGGKTTKDQTIQKRTEPAFIEPMQCKAVTALYAGENRTFDIKFDGYRCIAVTRGREVALFSRNEKVLNKRFPKIVQALASLEGDFVLDGELVALDSQGKPSFQLLQNNLSQALPATNPASDQAHGSST